MSERWIVDASPLITLGKIGEHRLLTEGTEDLLIPEAVAEEVLAGPPEDAARQLLEGGLGRRLAPLQVPPRILAWSLGRGETEVLALGLQKAGTRVVLDDAAARRCAAAFGIPLIGTLGIIVKAKKRGQIDSAAHLFHALREVGFRVDEATGRAVLRQIGESW